MDEKLFKELVSGIKEMKAVVRGKMMPIRSTRLFPSEVTQIRQNMQLSQPKFARLMGISVRTLQNWEQGHRKPTGPARVLLRVAEKTPDAVLNAVHE